MKRFALMALAVVLLSGCTTWTPEARLAVSRKSFNTAVNSLAAMQEAGKFSDEEVKNITTIIHLGDQSLDRWEAAIELGQPTKGFIADMDFIVRELVAKRIAAERSKKDE